MMAMQYFGEAYPSDDYPAAIYLDLERVDAPVGQLCIWCEEPVEEGDRGFIQSCMIRKHPVTDEYLHTREPVHHECNFRQTIGSVKHQRGECGCATGDFSNDDDAEYATLREAARAALAEFESR